MNDEILKLANNMGLVLCKSVTFAGGLGYGVLEDELGAFYRAAFNAGLEAAAKEGKVIQDSMSNDAWYDNPDPTWNFGAIMYRVKPEPKVIRVHAGPTYFQPVVYDTFEIPNLELEFTEGKLTGAKVL